MGQSMDAMYPLCEDTLTLSRLSHRQPQPPVDSSEQAELEIALRLSKENHKVGREERAGFRASRA